MTFLIYFIAVFILIAFIVGLYSVIHVSKNSADQVHPLIINSKLPNCRWTLDNVRTHNGKQVVIRGDQELEVLIDGDSPDIITKFWLIREEGTLLWHALICSNVHGNHLLTYKDSYELKECVLKDIDNLKLIYNDYVAISNAVKEYVDSINY